MAPAEPADVADYVADEDLPFPADLLDGTHLQGETGRAGDGLHSLRVPDGACSLHRGDATQWLLTLSTTLAYRLRVQAYYAGQHSSTSAALGAAGE